jgi:hypothetical protein
MEVNEIVVNENKNIIKKLSFERFPNKKNPKKIRKEWYEEEIMTVLATGQAMLIEKLINYNNDNPYDNVEIFIGDLQLVAKDVLNQFNKKIGSRIEYQIEDFFTGGRLIKENEKSFE